MKGFLQALLVTLLAGAALGAGQDAAPAGRTVKGTFVSEQRLRTKGDTSEREVVVYLREKVPGKHAAPATPVQVKQERLMFKPHVLAVLVGSQVEFDNADSVVHNVFSGDPCCAVDLDMPAASKKAIRLEKPGVAAVICRLHPDMSMFLVTLENPYFTTVALEKQAAADGVATYRADYEIRGVPPGDYVLTFWNKKLEPVEHELHVPADADARLDVLVAAKP